MWQQNATGAGARGSNGLAPSPSTRLGTAPRPVPSSSGDVRQMGQRCCFKVAPVPQILGWCPQCCHTVQPSPWSVPITILTYMCLVAHAAPPLSSPVSRLPLHQRDLERHPPGLTGLQPPDRPRKEPGSGGETASPQDQQAEGTPLPRHGSTPQASIKHRGPASPETENSAGELSSVSGTV